MRMTTDELSDAETKTIVTITNNAGELHLHKHDSDEHPYIAHFSYSAPEKNLIWNCDTEQKARLVVGLLNSIDMSLTDVDEMFAGYTSIPLPVTLAGKPYVTAYIKILEDQSAATSTRPHVAQLMNLTEQSVSNYLHRVRWDGCIECGSENTSKSVVKQANGDEVAVVYCKDCGERFVYPEDFRLAEHSKPNPNCVDELEQSVSVSGTVKLWCCESCGFYTADRDRHSVQE